MKVPILDVQVSPIELADLLTWIAIEVRASRPSLLVGHNLHSVYLYHTNEEFRTTYDRANLVLCDGFPIAFLTSRVSNIATSSLRIGSTDWIPKLGQVAGISRVAVIGASLESNRAFCELLNKTFSEEVKIESWSGENWNDRKAIKVKEEVLVFSPQLTFVGLGMPLQEHFLQLTPVEFPGLVALVGGAIDQLSGFQKNAPRLLGKIGIEWIWRLVTQPRRLFRRYVIEPWLLVAVLLKKNIKR